MKIGICGATGYSGREMIRILLRHPEADLIFLSSEQSADQMISDVFPEFRNRLDLVCQPLDSVVEKQKADVVFLALPHTVSMKAARAFLAKGIKVIDLSGDYRLDQKVYEKWYHHPHEDIENLKSAVYGLTEFFRDQVKEARLVSNPGCYPTCAALGLVPAIAGGWIDLDSIVIDAKSGVSGAGRSASLVNQFCEVNENLKAYKVGVHQHTPEIEKTLKHFAKRDINVTFVPHLIPMDRGILSTVYAGWAKPCKISQVLESYQKFYHNEPFIRVLPEGVFPQTQGVCGSNYCDIGIHVDERTGRVIIVSAIDNMVKGAAGQAVQNFNVMMGFQETTALL